MNTKKLTDTALTALDRVGYQLESFGITSKVNRHTLVALLMAEKSRFEGERDSLNAKVVYYRHLAESTADTALKPARQVAETVRNLFGGAKA